jgi:Beta-1,3-glucanase
MKSSRFAVPVVACSKTIHLPGEAMLRQTLWVVTLATLIFSPSLFAADDAPANFYSIVNNTNGKFTDEQVSWTLNGKTFTPLSQSSGAPAKMGGGGRLYIKLTGNDGETYKDFIEFSHNKAGWFGNTTQVDAFVIPMTLEVFDADGTSKKVGITESRTALFQAFKKETPAEFQSCVEGTKQIVSPHRADFRPGKTNADYYTKYIDDVWQTYATETKTPGGWTGQVVDGALIFTPPNGGKPFKCPRKPTSEEAFLGSGILGGLPVFCAAINRHVLADPADWHNRDKYYLAGPANFYAKFWHDHSINGKAYGFCYDDVNQQDTLIHAPKPTKVVITVNWDSPATR